MKTLFEIESYPIVEGQPLFVHPDYYRKAGRWVRVQSLTGAGDMAVVETDNGAHPTLPIKALSLVPHPDLMAVDSLAGAGIKNPTEREIQAWKLGRAS